MATSRLSLEYLASPHCNSGIGIRTARNGWPSGDGFELQILDAPGLVNDSTMAIYRNVEPLARADRSQEWNRVVIKADGPMISAWVNGQLVQQANTARHPELKHRHRRRLDRHAGSRRQNRISQPARPLRSRRQWIGRLVCAAPGLGPRTGLRSIAEPRASRRWPMASPGASRPLRSAGPEEQVLAELTGPGAVTQIWHSQPGGQLAFYFDAESKPSIECRPDQLPGRLPDLFVEQKEPVLTCLPYAKSLKIVLRKAEHTDYRIEYVTFPADVPVETFQRRPSRPAARLVGRASTIVAINTAGEPTAKPISNHASRAKRKIWSRANRLPRLSARQGNRAVAQAANRSPRCWPTMICGWKS